LVADVSKVVLLASQNINVAAPFVKVMVLNATLTR
jgi:hypothetical protein